MKIDWKRKLTSRKFWLAIGAFVALIVCAANGEEVSAEAIIMAGGTVIAYILGEGLTDYAAIKNEDEY